MEFKGYQFKMDDFDEGSRKVKVYLSAFGNVDSYGDIVQQGAFKKTLAENMHRIKYLWQHSAFDPIGKWEELKEDNFGLMGVGVLSNSTRGKDAFEYYKEGIITEHSIGYNTEKYEDDMKNSIRILKEVKLFEGSAVTWGANDKTPLIAMAKSMNIEPLEYLKKREEKLIKFLRNNEASDEAHELVELELRHIISTYHTLIEELKQPPPVALPEPPEPLTIDLVSIYNNI